MSFYAFCITVLVLVVPRLRCAASSDDCNNSLSDLEEALFNTGQNKLNLTAAFYPPREPPSRYISVHYTFLYENGSATDCSVKYYWAIGGSLLINPPTIFMFTSLLFSIPNNDIENIYLKLPHQCRGLVENLANGACSCSGRDGKLLDILTQQLKQYSKFQKFSEVVRDDTSAVKAICATELKQYYTNDKHVVYYLAATLVFPIMLMTGIAFLVRSTHKAIAGKLSQPSNHPNLAGLILTGICSMVFVIIMDIFAVDNLNKHEFKEENVTDTFAIKGMLITTLVLDVIIAVAYILLCLLYICGSYVENQSVLKILVRILIPYFYVIYGSETRDSLQSAEPKKDLLYWALVGLMVTPLFSVASHAGYIMMAWLTESPKTTAIALAAIGIGLFVFFTFRQCYTMNKIPTMFEFLWNDAMKRVNKPAKRAIFLVILFMLLVLTPALIIVYPLFITLLHCFNISLLWCAYCRDCPIKINQINNKVSENFSIKSFLLSLYWSGVIIGCVCFIISAFYQLPISTIQLPIYLENITQIIILVISLLVTYKIFTIGDETDVLKFLKNFIKHVRVIPDTPDGDLEAAGAAAGKLITVIVNKLYSKQTKTSLTQRKKVTFCISEDRKKYYVPKEKAKKFSYLKGSLKDNASAIVFGGITDELFDKQNLKVTVYKENIPIELRTGAPIIINNWTYVTASEDSLMTIHEVENELPEGTIINVPSGTQVTHEESNHEGEIGTFPSNTEVSVKNVVFGTVVNYPVSIQKIPTADDTGANETTELINNQVNFTTTDSTRITLDYDNIITLKQNTIVTYDGTEYELKKGTKLEVKEVIVNKNTEFTITEASYPSVTVIVPKDTKLRIAD